MNHIWRGALAAALAAASLLAGCRGDANFAARDNDTRDQSPTTEGPAVVGKKLDPNDFATGGSGAEADCETASATCVEPADRP